MQPPLLPELLELSNQELIVVVFITPWSGAANMLMSTFERLQKTHPTLKVFEYNTSDFTDLAEHFGINDIPTTLFLHQGKEAHRFSGPLSLKRIQARIEDLNL